jgi:hypothetical protein
MTDLLFRVIFRSDIDVSNRLRKLSEGPYKVRSSLGLGVFAKLSRNRF